MESRLSDKNAASGKVDEYVVETCRKVEESGNKCKVERTRIICWDTLRLHKGLFFLGSLGALFMAISSVIYLLNPLELFANAQLTLKPGTLTYEAFIKPPVKVLAKMYVFNYTNTEAFLKGTDKKLKLKEVGPYVFRDILENTNLTFNSNNTVTYIPRRHAEAVPEETNRDAKQEWIIVPNAAFLGVASYLSDRGVMVNLAFNAIAAMLNSEAFLNITVHDFLHGYDEPLIHYASKLVPEVINFNKIGYVTRMFDDGINVVTMNLNDKVTSSADGQDIRPLTIDMYNGSPGLKIWGYDHEDNTTHKNCNRLHGYATEGVLFPRRMQQNQSIVFYRKAFCRTLAIVFDHASITERGIPANHYTLPADALDNANPENSCYCDRSRGPCLRKGLSDISPCYYNIPVAVSFPHFYNGDPTLRDQIEGLSPNVESHGSVAVIQPDIGVIMMANSRIQTNVILGDIRFNLKAAPLSNMAVPLFWTDISFAGLPDDLNDTLHLLVVVGPILQQAITLAFATAGLIMLSITAFHVAALARNNKANSLYKAGYESVRIVPIIRRESLI